MNRRVSEFCIELCIKVSGFAVVAFVFLIFLFLLRDSISFFRIYSVGQFPLRPPLAADLRAASVRIIAASSGLAST